MMNQKKPETDRESELPHSEQSDPEPYREPSQEPEATTEMARKASKERELERRTERPRDGRKRLVILGTGFAAVMIVKRFDPKLFDVTIISPRNHFLFTPLLPSTTVGTVEFRSIIEPIRKTRRGIDFMQATCNRIDPEKRRLFCRNDELDREFAIEYDLLVISVGADNNTFGVPGVEEHALFLKELVDARNIRERIIACLERADIPDISDEERRRLLHFMIVGGGPTGVEFAAELHDLIDESLRSNYPDLEGKIQISLFEATTNILSTFDQDLRSYTMQHFDRQGIELKLNRKVSRVGEGVIEFEDGTCEHGGLILWSTGYSPTGLTQSLSFPKDHGRLVTNEYLQIPDYPDIYALGDCATVAGEQLPQTAQLAMQAGKYLGKALNRKVKGKKVEAFRFHNLGMLAYVGENRALADIPKTGWHLRGALTYLLWRSAYLTRLVSLKNKILVLFDWIKTRTFGRDLSRF